MYQKRNAGWRANNSLEIHSKLTPNSSGCGIFHIQGLHVKRGRMPRRTRTEEVTVMAEGNRTQDHGHETEARRQQPPEQTGYGLDGPAPTTVDPALAMQRVAGAPPPAIRPEDILALQRTVGNRIVQRMLAHRQRKAAFPMVQAKLTVNAPGDRHEREADRVAEQVTTQMKAQPAQEVRRKDPTGVGELHAESGGSVQRQVEEEDLQAKAVDHLQRGSTEAVPQIDSDMEAKINTARGTGRPLPDDARGPMEQAFGADFSGVRVHTSSEADVLSNSLQARAFTTGQDIFFRQSQYAPHTSQGQELLAHELTHVVQQTGAGRLQRDSTQKLAQVQSRSPGNTVSLAKVKKYLDFVKVKRNTTKIWGMIWAKLNKRAKQPDDPFGHWWTEIGDRNGAEWDPKESYGWWPGERVGFSKAGIWRILRGVPGELNAGHDNDPDHNDKAEIEFHPVVEVDENEGYDTVRQRVTGQIRNFSKGYKGIWNWFLGMGKNCHTFQKKMMKAVGLRRGSASMWLMKPQPSAPVAEPQVPAPQALAPVVAKIMGVKELEGVGEDLEYQFDAYFTQRGISLLDLEGLSPESRKQLVDYLGVSPSKMDEILTDEYGYDVKLFQ